MPMFYHLSEYWNASRALRIASRTCWSTSLRKASRPSRPAFSTSASASLISIERPLAKASRSWMWHLAGTARNLTSYPRRKASYNSQNVSRCLRVSSSLMQRRQSPPEKCLKVNQPLNLRALWASSTASLTGWNRSVSRTTIVRRTLGRNFVKRKPNITDRLKTSTFRSDTQSSASKVSSAWIVYSLRSLSKAAPLSPMCKLITTLLVSSANQARYSSWNWSSSARLARG